MLKGCPFCGGKATSISMSDSRITWISCLQCESRGAMKLDIRESSAAWNLRFVEPEPKVNKLTKFIKEHKGGTT